MPALPALGLVPSLPGIQRAARSGFADRLSSRGTSPGMTPLGKQSMATLAGKTLFITGASRGIGLAIALRAARDGANVAIAAKTAEPHPKLPGTIYTAAEEIEAAGGKALPLRRATSATRSRSQAAVGQDRRDVRRHRHLRQQRQRHQLTGTLADRHEALRPDARHQRARHLPRARKACIPHLQEGGEPAHPEPLAAARHGRASGSRRTSPTRWPSSA